MGKEKSDPNVEFMLMRSLGVCLTAGIGSATRWNDVTFNVTRQSAVASEIFYRPLLHLLNAYRLVTSFDRHVMGSIERVFGVSRSAGNGVPGAVDWEKTAQSRLQGTRDVYFCDEGTFDAGDRLLAALVVEEFRFHVRVIVDFVRGKDGLAAVEAVDLVARRLARWETANQSRWRAVVEAHDFPLAQAQELLAEHLKTFRELLATEGHNSDKDLYAIYKTGTFTLYRDAAETARRLASLLEWRHQYVALDTGIGIGSELTFRSKREAHYLFEIWCFVELAGVMSAMGAGKLVQRSLLKRRNESNFGFERNNSELDEQVDIFYDFLGNRSTGYAGERVLKDSHVEWYVENPADRYRGVVIDTKYKSWSSADNLTVLGYMNDFGVDRGAVIFRGELRKNAYLADYEREGLVVKSFGRQKERRFCALCLRPEPAFVERNSIVLKDFVERLILD